MVTKSYKTIIYEEKPPIAYITLNRPEALNSLSQTLQREVREALEYAGWDRGEEIRVIVLKGAGRCFSSGFDISGKEGVAPSDPGMREIQATSKNRFVTAFWDVFWKNPKALIALVHGYCLAGGMATASFCDLCIAADDTLFGYPFTRDNAPWLPATWPWLLGMRASMYLQMTGNLIDAQEAYRLGLVNKVVPRDKLEEEGDKLARTIGKIPNVNTMLAKRTVHSAYEAMHIREVQERSMELESIGMFSKTTNPLRAEFEKLVKEKGLKFALDARKQLFAEEDAWWMARMARPPKK